ncbi:cullin-4B [Amniculicola lignicola CBS 123094]|uniref:Cullin-4B n=1 Tax=Amniculicola lignicola CBS 123094 TaxID=1392246 RepID=A0A6A5W2F1_9PLEO|nr:cullin-4B [Amniculicola lignicola CBS 123094]
MASTTVPRGIFDFPAKNGSIGTSVAGGKPGSEVVDLTDGSSMGSSSKAKTAMRGSIQNHTPNGTVRRIGIKNFKPQRKVDPMVYFESIWAKVDKALDTVFEGREVDFGFEEMYQGIQGLCRRGLARETLERLVGRCRVYVKEVLLVGVEKGKRKEDVDVLREALGVWSTWQAQLVYVKYIFLYLEGDYLKPQSKTLDIITTDIFREIIFHHARLRPKIVNGACELVATYRAGKELETELFANAVKMFNELQVYTKFFEPRMLELSQTYALEWADSAIAEKRLDSYVKAAKDLMDKELARVKTFELPKSTKRDLVTLLEDHLISRQESKLLGHDGIADLLDENAVGHLHLLYQLLQRRRLGDRIKPAFMKWIEDTGTIIVFDEKDQDDMVVKLLTLKRQLDTIWKVSFERNAELGHGLRESFETFMNKTKKTSQTWNTDNSKPGEMIAKYVDMLLRGGAKVIPKKLMQKGEKPQQPAADVVEDNEEEEIDEDAEISNQLDQVLDLFRFVHGKAVFEAFYKKDLARRLLMGRSASADAERSMLARLKTECGAGFTSNLEQMFKDIELAREEMTSYKNIMSERDENQSKLDLTVNILSASAWPTYPDVPVIVPAQIKTALDKFEKHYKAKHTGRKLDWKHSLAHCQIKAKFPRGNKELVVSSFQAIVLLLFNGLKDDEHLDYNYLKEATGLPLAELNRTLQSLACAKLRPLTKTPKSRDISPTDIFSLNATFHSDKLKIKINTVQLKETPAENKETHERVAADRNYETQAAIVRIMKARKTITHAELVAETIKVTRSRGTLDVQGIKRNLDRLIEKEFIEREEGGVYSYIA